MIQPKNENGEVKIQLFGKQWDAFNCPKRFVLCSAGIQGGKTFVGAVWLLNKIRLFPDDSHLICAPTYKILQQSTLPKFRELVPSSIAKFHEQDSYFEIVGGKGIIYVRSAEDPDTLEGMTLRSAWLDEAGNMKKRVWIIIQGRTAILGGQVFMTTSPYTMNWLYHDVFKPGEDGHKDFGLFQWMSIQNPMFPKAEYQRAMTTMNATDFARRYKGLWRKREGLVYQQWNPITMTFDGASPIPIKEVIAGVDWGYQHPAAIAVIGIGDKPSHVILDEWYKTKQTIQLMVDAAKELKARWGIKWFYADSARPEYIAEFNKNGLATIEGNKEIVPGINEVRLRIETGNLIVSKACKNTLEELEMYAYPEEFDSEEPLKQFDHMMDAIRYPMYTYKIAPPVYGADLSPFWQEVREDIKVQQEGVDRENDEQWFDIGEVEM